MRFDGATHRFLRSLQLLDERLGLGDDEDGQTSDHPTPTILTSPHFDSS
jgi:hypothetical protein